jgi:hypothetical protein
MISKPPDSAEVKLGLTAEPLAFNVHYELDRNTIVGEFKSLQQSAIAAISDRSPPDATFLGVVESIQSGRLGVGEIASAWQSLSKMDTDLEILSVDSRILTALSLASHSDMWTWFNNNVTEPTRRLAAIPIQSLQEMVQPKLENEWIYPLFHSIHLSLLLCQDVKLAADKFFPGLEAPDYEARYKSGPIDSKKILGYVESAVALWLRFQPRPGMSLDTSRGVATFISIARKAFGSLDFLYLSSVQNGVKKLRSILTVEGIHLTKVPWERLADELNSHPLADPNSEEAVVLSHVKRLLWAVSSLHNPCPSETATRYKEAAKMGGSDGVEAFAQWIGQPPRM